MRATHIVSGAFLSVVALICLFWVIPATTSPPDSELDLAPAFIPMVAVITLLVLSIVLGLTAYLKKADNTELHDEFGADASGMGREEFANLGLWVLAAAVSWLIMAYVGFEPAMTVFLGVVLYFIGLRNYWLIVGLALAVPIFLSQFVWFAFDTQMPGFWR